MTPRKSTGSPSVPRSRVARAAGTSNEVPSGAGDIASEDKAVEAVNPDATANAEHDLAAPGAVQAEAEAAESPVTDAAPLPPATAPTPGVVPAGGDTLARVVRGTWARTIGGRFVRAGQGSIISTTEEAVERGVRLGTLARIEE